MTELEAMRHKERAEHVGPLIERLEELVALSEMHDDNVPGQDLYVEILLAKDVIADAKGAMP